MTKTLSILISCAFIGTAWSQQYQQQGVNAQLQQAKENVKMDEQNIQKAEAKKRDDESQVDIDEATIKKYEAQLEEDKAHVKKLEDRLEDQGGKKKRSLFD